MTAPARGSKLEAAALVNWLNNDFNAAIRNASKTTTRTVREAVSNETAYRNWFNSLPPMIKQWANINTPLGDIRQMINWYNASAMYRREGRGPANPNAPARTIYRNRTEHIVMPRWCRESMPANHPPVNSPAYKNWLAVIGPRRNIPNISLPGKGTLVRAADINNAIRAMCDNWRYVRLITTERRTFGNSNGGAVVYNSAVAGANTIQNYAFVTDTFKGKNDLLEKVVFRSRGDIVSLGDINYMVSRAKNYWDKLEPIKLTWDDCHANCHGSCHGSGGWR